VETVRGGRVRGMRPSKASKEVHHTGGGMLCAGSIQTVGKRSWGAGQVKIGAPTKWVGAKRREKTWCKGTAAADTHSAARNRTERTCGGQMRLAGGEQSKAGGVRIGRQASWVAAGPRLRQMGGGGAGHNAHTLRLQRLSAAPQPLCPWRRGWPQTQPPCGPAQRPPPPPPAPARRAGRGDIGGTLWHWCTKGTAAPAHRWTSRHACSRRSCLAPRRPPPPAALPLVSPPPPRAPTCGPRNMP
jgi:hypothetical protein